MMKKCRKCLESKDIDQFHKDAKGIFGCRSRCKVCELTLKKLKYHADPEAHLLRGKKWRDANPEKNRMFQKKSYPMRKKWMSDKYNTDEVYRAKMKAKTSAYRNDPKNRLAIRRTKRNATLKHRKDPKNRITSNLRRNMLHCLAGKRKADYSLNLIGCTREQLIIHLESLFRENMSWDNYGISGWVIDHIIPCCSFDLSITSEQKKCFHYTNLRPLWGVENARKGAQDKLMKVKTPTEEF